MKPLTISELDKIVNHLQGLLGGTVQEVRTSGGGVGLKIWKRGAFWIWVEMNPKLPLLFPLPEAPTKKSIVKPTGLFLRSHAVGKIVNSIQRLENLGRVVEIDLLQNNGDECKIEIRLLPGGQNLIAKSSGKQISWFKVKDLGDLRDDYFQPKNRPSTERSIEEIRSEWTSLKARTKGVVSGISHRQMTIEKKCKVLQRVKEELSLKDSSKWREAGEWLKCHGLKSIPHELSDFVDSSQTLAWNIEFVFKKAKEIEQKRLRTIERIRQLESELADLQSQEEVPSKDDETVGNIAGRSKSWYEKLGIKTRKLMVGSYVVFMGKNAKDNLQLLRKSQPWDLWIHLKDYPSAHAILHKKRGDTPGPEDLKKVAQWIIKESFHNRETLRSMGQFEVIATECRFVTPIKGDRLGRVTFRNESTFKVGS